jgi:peptidyl-prolyl cis-trans isomerase C
MTSLVIEGVEIPEQLIRDEMPNHPAATSAEAHKNAARALAIKALLLNRASELDLLPDPEPDEEGRLETLEEALIRQVFAHELVPQVPSEAECLRFYEARPDNFFTPELYEASHILVLESSRDLALDLVKQLLADQSGFASLARSLSVCPSGQIGGSLGQLQRGDLVVEVEEALLSTPVGAIFPEPVASQFGWHILRLDRRVVRQRLPFEAVKAKILMHLESRAWMAASAKYVEGLLDQSKAKGVALRLGEAGDIERPSLSLGGLVDDANMAVRIEPWLAAVDPELLSRVSEASIAQGKPIVDLVRSEVRHFLDHADDESFTQLVSAAQGSDDPMLASVACILKSRLAPPAKKTFTLIKKN